MLLSPITFGIVQIVSEVADHWESTTEEMLCVKLLYTETGASGLRLKPSTAA